MDLLYISAEDRFKVSKLSVKAFLDKTLPQKMENEQKLYHFKVNVMICVGEVKKIKIKKCFVLFPPSKQKQHTSKQKYFSTKNCQ